MGPSLIWTAVSAIALVVAVLFWRYGAILLGRARAVDTAEARIEKWNSYVVPMLRKMLDADVAIATAGSFASHDARRSIATWSLAPTLVPDVDYVAVATLGEEGQKPTVLAIGLARTVRNFLGDGVIEQTLWGHRAFLYAWPQGVALQSLVEQLTTADAFRREHGLELKPGSFP